MFQTRRTWPCSPLHDTSPRQPVDDPTDTGLIYLECPSQITLRLSVRSTTTNLSHVLDGELHVASSSATTKSTLRYTISNVVSARPEEEVGNFDTGRVIALVANEHPSWNRTMSKLPGNSVGESISRFLLGTPWVEPSIPALVTTPCPKTTSFSSGSSHENLKPRPKRKLLTRMVATLGRAMLTPT